jgi:hypothetical protein
LWFQRNSGRSSGVSARRRRRSAWTCQSKRALEPFVDVDGLARPLVEVGVVAHRADEVGDARRRLLELGADDAGARARRDEPQSGGQAVLADGLRDALDPLGPEPRLGDGGRDLGAERLGELVLAIALGQRVQRLGCRLGARLGAE